MFCGFNGFLPYFIVNFDAILTPVHGMAARFVAKILVEPADTIFNFGIDTENV
jgi:hypothetical protein